MAYICFDCAAKKVLDRQIRPAFDVPLIERNNIGGIVCVSTVCVVCKQQDVCFDHPEVITTENNK